VECMTYDLGGASSGNYDILEFNLASLPWLLRSAGTVGCMGIPRMELIDGVCNSCSVLAKASLGNK